MPIYQTAAYAFDSADHGAALFNLEEEGYRYSRISNPTVAVLEKRITELEGGVAAIAAASGQAALFYALANVADGGGNIVSTSQLYGTSHTLLGASVAPFGHHGTVRGQRPGRGDGDPDGLKTPARCSAKRWAIRRQYLRHRSHRQGGA